MPRVAARAILLLTAFAVLANAQCFGKCLTRDCNESQPVPAGSCHRHGGAPSETKTVAPCTHLAVVAEDASDVNDTRLEVAVPALSFVAGLAIRLESLTAAR